MNNNPISALRSLKDARAELTAEDFKQTAAELGLPVSQVAGVASFYSEFTGKTDGELRLDMLEGGAAGPILSGGGGSALALALAEPEAIIGKISRAALKGRGGAGYPVGRKWSLTAHTDASQKFIICNGSEGENDTYKDLKLMLCVPDKIIEGMVICAAAAGAQMGYIYIRSEYRDAFAAVQRAVESAYEQGVLGKDILGSGLNFDIEVFRGAGAYVCGEETALLRALEGLRGETSQKPPYPGVQGLFGKPTIINNVESFAAVPGIFLGCEPAKLYTVSGCVEHSGVYEMPYGVTVRALAEKAGLSDGAVAFQLGGGSTGTFAGMDKLDTPLTTEGCAAAGLSLGTGSIRFFPSKDAVADKCRESAAFLAAQSCGKCVPCKYGTKQLSELLCADIWNSGQISELSEYLALNARCGLGQAAPAMVKSALAVLGSDNAMAR